MSPFIIRLFPILFIIVLTSCGKKLTETDAVRLPKVKEKDLMNALDSISLRKPDFFYSKVDTKFDDGNRKVNFKTSIKLKADSDLNAIITYAGIPLATAMITTDSVKITNKKDKCYILENLDYFKENFGVDFKFKNIEELLLGLPLDYNIDDKYFQINDPYNYVVSSHRKRDIRRTERGKLDEDILIKYFLTNDLKNVKRLEIESIEDSTNITVDYLSHQQDKGFTIPKFLKIEIRSKKKNIFIEMSYDKAEINEPKEMIIVIPESYGKCE